MTMLSKLLRSIGLVKEEKVPPSPLFKRNAPLEARKNFGNNETACSPLGVKSEKPQDFDVKEFVEHLGKKIQQEDRSSTKDHCLQALEVATSLSQYQREENKVSLIKGLISFKEAMMTVRAIRWREGLFCPHCHGRNIKIISIDTDKYEYKCLDCEKDDEGGKLCLFDDLTGINLPTDMASVIQWVLCIYLQIFLSTGKISKYLGVDPEYALHLIHMINVDSKINEKALKKNEGSNKGR